MHKVVEGDYFAKIRNFRDIFSYVIVIESLPSPSSSSIENAVNCFEREAM